MLRDLKMRWLEISITMDVGLTILALLLAKYIREYIPSGIYFDAVETFKFAKLDEPLYFNYEVLVPLILIIWLGVFSYHRIYGSGISINQLGQIPPIFVAVTGATLILAGVAYFFFRDLSRFLFIYFYILDILFLTTWRKMVLWLMQRNRLSDWCPKQRILVVGNGILSKNVTHAIKNLTWSGLEIVGVIDIQSNPRNYMETVLKQVTTAQVDEVIFALSTEYQHLLKEMVWKLQPLSVNIRLIPDVTDLVFIRASIEDFAGLLMIGLREPALSVFDRLLKRIFDMISAILLLMFLSPLFLLIALALKLESREEKSVFYIQQRVGEGGNLFWMYKFRTMSDGADKNEVEILGGNGQPGVNKIPDDPRVTRVGRFLRRTSLDELPQLINVVKGDMSLVGPRPELPWMVQRYERWQYQRFAVPQGMTGWWQIRNRNRQLEYDVRVDDDLYYIHNYTFILDLQILLATMWAIIRGEGAY